MVLGKLPKFDDERLLVGLETSDDAAVYRISDDLALIQTVDFFPPVVDDPYTFGQIAAANALSDVYAMGGEPRLALNIVCFPNSLSRDILTDMLKGGADKVREAGAILVGGHSIQDEEPKYGLCVTGFVDPKKLYKNFGSRIGDVLVLTKQIGSGIVNTALKAGKASEVSIKEAILAMKSLNKKAKEAAEGFPVHACTDITGFGLLGHCAEMASASKVSFVIKASAIASIVEARKYAQQGFVPTGTHKNQEYFGKEVRCEGVDQVSLDLLYDPQTSGGLLFCIPKECLDEFLKALKEKNLDTRVSLIGSVTERQKHLITVKM